MALTPEHCVEEGLRSIEDRVAMLRFFSDSIGDTDLVPEHAFFSGLADSLGEIEAIARAVRARSMWMRSEQDSDQNSVGGVAEEGGGHDGH